MATKGANPETSVQKESLACAVNMGQSDKKTNMI